LKLLDGQVQVWGNQMQRVTTKRMEGAARTEGALIRWIRHADFRCDGAPGGTPSQVPVRPSSAQ